MAPKPKFNTLTTAGRIEKAGYEKQQQEQQVNQTSQQYTNPSMSTHSRAPSPPPAKKRRRNTNHPPPSEMAAEAKAKAAAKDKQKSKRKAPLTTKEKQEAHAVRQRKAKQSVVHDGSSLRVVLEGSAASSGGERAQTVETRNLMDFMRELGQMNSTPVPKAKKTKKPTGPRKESVLVRSTEETKRVKQEAGQQSESKAKGTEGSYLMSLPLKVRKHIWREVIVKTQFFVYPISSPEQPDLAMTNRQIREEVLEIYYGENTFAVEIPNKTGKGKKSKVTSTLKPVEKWVSALQVAGHLQRVSRWAFVWAPVPAARVGATTPNDELCGQDAIVSLQYPAPGVGQIGIPQIEIHRQASCMLPSHEQYTPCLQKDVPVWLSDAVAGSVLAEDDRGRQVLAIAKVLREKGEDLVEARCGILQGDDV